ncbi:MAG: MATE family efflux transporter [Spongiibacteraceae bacterium]
MKFTSLPTLHQRILYIAAPMILANISTPLLGLVDTAILGHLNDSLYLSAVAIGASLLAFIYWGFNFLRMGTTGASAQCRHQYQVNQGLLLKNLALALVISAIILLAAAIIVSTGLELMNTPASLYDLAASYLRIRLYSAPAVLCSYVIIGWHIGHQNTRWALILALTSNILNIILDYLLIVILELNSDGAALASVTSEYVAFGIALYSIRHSLRLLPARGAEFWRAGVAIRSLLKTNFHLFLRTICLLFCFAFFTAQGAALGPTILAANAILLQLVLVSAYGLDGFAHAAEALSGDAIAKNDHNGFIAVCKACASWSLLMATIGSICLFFGQSHIVMLMTSIDSVHAAANHYYLWLVAMPVLSVSSYLLDGIFIGAMRSKAMLYTVLLCAGGVFLPSWQLSQAWGNHGLWLSFCLFNFARGLSLGMVFIHYNRRRYWFPNKAKTTAIAG